VREATKFPGGLASEEEVGRDLIYFRILERNVSALAEFWSQFDQEAKISAPDAAAVLRGIIDLSETASGRRRERHPSSCP
jgi:hypothetical protein